MRERGIPTPPPESPTDDQLKRAIDDELKHEIAPTEYAAPIVEAPEPPSLRQSPAFAAQETEAIVPLEKVKKPGKPSKRRKAGDGPKVDDLLKQLQAEKAVGGQVTSDAATRAVSPVYEERMKELEIAYAPHDLSEAEDDGSQPLDPDTFGSGDVALSQPTVGSAEAMPVEDDQIESEESVVDVRRREHEGAIRAMWNRIDKWFRT